MSASASTAPLDTPRGARDDATFAPVRRGRARRAQRPRRQRWMRTVRLDRSSFRHGPVFIDDPDVRVLLVEDVTVDFRAVQSPDASPFHLGFFCAIGLRASGITVDLGGHTIAMAEAYRQQQRFFAIVEIGESPLPQGKLGFDVDARAFHDIEVTNGTLGASSHFSIHSIKGGSRYELHRLRMVDYEVGAISLNECHDLRIHDCQIGRPAAPLTSARFLMLRDLAQSADKAKLPDVARELRSEMGKGGAEPPAVADSLVRAIVIAPSFNVAKPVATRGAARLQRVTIKDVTFADITARPELEVGVRGPKGEPLRDLHGNIILLEHARAGSVISRTQALLTEKLPRHERRQLMEGATAGWEPFTGRDIRNHDLLQKASLFVRIDGCDDVVLADLRCGQVTSHGTASSAVGVMLNDCARVDAARLLVGGIVVTDECVNALSDDRPQSGMYVRGSRDVHLEDFTFASADRCSCSLRDVHNCRMARCNMNAPMTAFRATALRVDE